VCLRYQEGKLLSSGRPLDEWLKVDINTCREKNNDFLLSGCHDAQPSSSHQSNWQIARSFLRRVGRFYLDDPEASDSRQTDATVFEKWLKQRIHKVMLQSSELFDFRVESTTL
jgi:hypothetical protein